MAIYTTFFLCDQHQLSAGFPGWRPPLPHAVTRHVKNPFTGETMTVESCAPEWPENEGFKVPEYRVVSMQSDYRKYLESRLPQFVQSRPHWAAKNLTEVELTPLAESLGVEADFECPLYGPPSVGATLHAIPSKIVAGLASLDDNGLGVIGNKWAAIMSSSEHTHSVSGNKLNDGWSQQDALGILNSIAALSRQAGVADRMYLLIEV
jgi:hypothetical protein